MVLVYGQVIGYGFVEFDDFHYVVGNQQVSRGLTWEGFRWAFTQAHSANWHPLTWLSHMLDCQLFGLDPAGHHVTSVAFHALNGVLLFLVLRGMTGEFWPSLVAAGLFALHPLRVESVAWVAERKDVLSTFFWLLTMLAYARYAKRPGAGRYLLVCVSLALGLMTKPMVVTLPCVLLLLDLWPLARWRQPGSTDAGFAPRPLRLLLLEKVPLLLLSLASSVVTVAAQSSGGAVITSIGLPLWPRIANALVSYVSYLRMTIWPTDLAVFYPHRALFLADVGALTIRAMAAGVLLAAVTVVVIRLVRRRPYLAVGWLWYLGTLAPVIGVVQVGTQAMADRYTYVPLIGIYVLFAWGARDLAARSQRARLAVGIAIPAALAACLANTWLQVRTWRDSVTLFEHALHATGRNYFAHYGLGVVRLGAGDLARSAYHFRETLRANPQFVEARNGLGNVLLQQGDLESARAHLEQALGARPDYVHAHNNLGNVFFAAGDLDRAAAHYRRAVELRPDYADALTNLGSVSFKRGNLPEAEAYYERAFRLRPDDTDTLVNTGILFEEQERWHAAAARFEQALRIQPDNAVAWRHLERTREAARQDG